MGKRVQSQTNMVSAKKKKKEKRKKNMVSVQNPPCVWCNFSIYDKESLTFWHEEQFLWKWAG